MANRITTLFARAGRLRVVASGAGLWLMMGAYCGLAVDFTETFLITDSVDRIEIDVDDGNVDAVAYDREAILLKRHTFGYERILGVPDFTVEDGVIRFEAHCKKQGVCTFDHLLELPLGIGFDITMLDGRIDLGYIDGAIAVALETGYFRGVQLGATQCTFTAESADADLEFAVVPESVTVELDDGEVYLTVPTGAYRCDFDVPGEAVLDGTEITCDDAATSTLRVKLGSGTLTVTGTAP